MSSKKPFNGRNSKKTNRNFVKETNNVPTQKETKPVEKTEDSFSQKQPKDAHKANSIPIKSANPRQVSFFILNKYFSEKSNLKFLLNDFLKKYPLSDLDKRFVFEVVKGTVRYLIRIDFLISLFSNKSIKTLDKDVLNILRQAVYQILYMDKTPGYAAVYESVEIAKKHIGTYSSRFVNAVLRKINALPGILEFLDNSINKAANKSAERLSVIFSYPEWLTDYWIKSYGVDRTALLLKLLNCEPRLFIRVNRLKTDKTKLINIFKESGMLQNRDFFAEPFDIIETPGSCKVVDTDAKNTITQDNFKRKTTSSEDISPVGTAEVAAETIGIVRNFEKTDLFNDCIILKSVQNIEKIPGYLSGHFSVQDFSSQFAVKYFLCPTGSDKILDICSAPGGKATYMAELTDGKAEILSVDINAKKMDLLEENIMRLGIKNITILNADVTNTDFLGQDGYENYFDKIFIDAPCSALGTISKNPDAKYDCTLSDMERLGEITVKILSAAGKYLKPGGIIVLYKCTLSEIENQDPVNRFVLQDPGKYRLSEPFFEIMPDMFSSEAGFICMLKKSE